MPNTQRRYTAADFDALPESKGTRYEIVDGELFVSPAPIPRHEVVVRRLTRLVEDHVLAVRLPLFVVNKGDVYMSDDTVVEPDVFVCPTSQLTTTWRDVRSVLLAVEVLSPTTMRLDRYLKRKRFMAFGVEAYWIVDAEHEQVEVWHPGDEFPAVESERLAWRVAPDAPELVIDLPALFAGLPR